MQKGSSLQTYINERRLHAGKYAGLSPDRAVRARVGQSCGVDVLIELEQATNPRVRDEAGEIALVRRSGASQARMHPG